MKRLIATIALAAGLLTVLLPGAAIAAHATPISRANALLSAKQYLEYQPFSYKGLIKQLKFEGYSTGDATYGVSHAGANWTKQAVLSAKQYLHYQPFSYTGLVQQLEFEGFTLAQARYGAHAAGL
jgi:hypothetical protein